VRSVNGPKVTIIKGSGPAGDTAVRCLYLGSNATLIGFTLTHGYAWMYGSWKDDFGGGVFCEPSAVLSNCILTGNSAEEGGGAYGGNLYNCIVYYNTAPDGSNWDNGTITYFCTTPARESWCAGKAQPTRHIDWYGPPT
jgi:hypothetical protein